MCLLAHAKRLNLPQGAIPAGAKSRRVLSVL